MMASSIRFTAEQLRLFSLSLFGCMVIAGPAHFARAAALPPPYEDLVMVKSKRLDAIYLLPGADFRSYTKVMIDPAQVSFRKDWMKNENRSRGTSRRIDESDMHSIAAAMRSGFDDIFAAAFKAKGYEVVTAPGPEVLRLSPAVVNVYVNAPLPMSAATRTYIVQAGEATLMLEVRDVETGAVLGVAIDRRETRNSGGVQIAMSSVNSASFAGLFRHWANICASGLETLKAQPVQSPQPAKARH
jgi:hypothetical protein